MKAAKIREHLKLHPSEKTLIVFALLIIIAGGVAVLFQLHPWAKGPLEITLQESSPASGETQVYVDGAVAHPGWFPLNSNASIGDIIDMAGGLAYKSSATDMKLYIPSDSESDEPQKISINRADAWLLDALPGIGPTTAQRIIDYREANGPFVTISEIKLVPGIGDSVYENIKDLITVE
jgi:competence protein ComEA